MSTNEIYPMQVAASLTPNQRDIFYAEYGRRCKDYHTALFLAIITGWWIGGHKFYLGKPLQGILYLLFALTAVSLILTILDVLKLHKTVDAMNRRLADEIVSNVREYVSM
jgi:TM2 domain-containing membrane protein YozV